MLTSASNIVVVVLDSGIRATHEDPASNLWTNLSDGGHGYHAFTATNDPDDDSSSHATMVAGALGAVGNNGRGVTGLAWRVQMMAGKCLTNGTGSDSTRITCIDDAIANGAKIIIASFDSPTIPTSPPPTARLISRTRSLRPGSFSAPAPRCDVF